jgi:hypothetical protein
VALALALEIDEEHIKVMRQDSFFFNVDILHEGEWLVKEINDNKESVVNTINAKASTFGGKIVFCKPAKINSVELHQLNHHHQDTEIHQ